jgi:NAD(P)-dependent dehydrogenase (short-subunit alcohol dehydrogenase family)
MNLEGMRIVITGASAGIGAATARLAASRGAYVYLSDLDDEAGEALARGICADGGEARYQHCDVTDEEQVRALMVAAAAAFGGIDVLHNNAGIHESMIGSNVHIETMSRATFERVLQVNLVGPWMCAKYALPYLKTSGNASIINAGSSGSFSGYPQNAAYGASKGGIALLTKNLAVDLAPYGVRVNAYCPASIETRMVQEFLAASPQPEALLNAMTKTHLIPRLGQPVEVAELVCFLASSASSFVNGVLWLIDGGSLAWRGTIDVLGMEGEKR